jgi:hypothetical protein
VAGCININTSGNESESSKELCQMINNICGRKSPRLTAHREVILCVLNSGWHECGIPIYQHDTHLKM